ncbi:MAG: hypothetical protein HYU66_23880, partial [Armatimonadetes bacterium]|nr:hypothetical protein [Armatimonadota bacterium]
MKKLKRGRWARPVSWLTMLAWMAVPVLPVAPARAQLTPPPTLAVVQVVNQSGSSVQNLGARAAVAINERFASSGKYTVLGQAAVDGAIQSAGAVLPLRADVRDATLLRIARTLQADYLVLAVIDSVECDAGQKLAVVKSRVQVFGRLAEGDVTEANITAFNLDKSTSEAMLIDDALEQNAMSAVREVTRQLGVRGKVIARPLESSVRVSFDERDYIRLGDKLVVLRNGLRTGVLEVAATHASDAECRVVERSHPELQVAINDEVVLYQKGTGRTAADNSDYDVGKDVHTAPEHRRHNQSVLVGALIGVAALAAGAWLITRSNDKRDDDRTARLVSPPNGATVQVDTENRLTTPLSFATTTALSVDSATFQLAADPGFTQLLRADTQAGTAATRQGGGTQQATQEPSFTFIFTPSQTAAFVPPGAYFWRVIVVSGTKVHASNVFGLNVVRQGGGSGAALGSPVTLRAIPGDSVVEIQWSPVAGATGYQIFRRTLPPAVGGAAGRARTWTSPTGSN